MDIVGDGKELVGDRIRFTNGIVEDVLRVLDFRRICVKVVCFQSVSKGSPDKGVQ